MTAEAVVEAIISDVRAFSGDIQQNDDMTIVVIKHCENLSKVA